jgi:hypothetical protein
MGVGHAPNLGADPIYFLWQLRHNTVNVWPLEADPTITLFHAFFMAVFEPASYASFEAGECEPFSRQHSAWYLH